jgi:hypothetical protein
MVFYSGLYLQSLNTKPAANGLLEISLDHLEQADIKSIEVDIKDGGL